MNSNDILPQNRKYFTQEEFENLPPAHLELLKTLDLDVVKRHRDLEVGGYRWRMNSQSADARACGISRVQIEGFFELIPEIKSLLEDDAPVVYELGSRPVICEVRANALAALQHLYRAGKKTPDFGPVKVRKSMPAHIAEAQATAALSRLDDRQKRELTARVDEAIRTRIQPAARELEAVRSYRILQELGLVEYRTEEVDPLSYLTPLQEAERRRQTEQPRPLPHLRIASARDPRRTLGFLYRDPLLMTWALDFAECDEAQEARDFVDRALRYGDKEGEDELRSVQEFVGRNYGAEIKRPGIG